MRRLGEGNSHLSTPSADSVCGIPRPMNANDVLVLLLVPQTLNTASFLDPEC